MINSKSMSRQGRRLGLVLFSTILLMSLSHWPAAAEDSAVALKNEAQKYYWGIGVKKNHKMALSLYERAAALGDSEASYIAGGMYYKGMGTVRDPYKAFKYLDYAAKNGKSTPESNRALAEFYILGQVVPQNFQKAVKSYENAANAGDSNAQLELGYLYFTGRGVEQDFPRAFKWFREAALKNYNMAQYNMGIMWYTGSGTDRSDLARAYAWLSIAAANSYPQAAAARDYLKSTLSREELERAQAVAAELYDQIQR